MTSTQGSCTSDAWTRRAATAVLVPLGALMLAACSSVQQAVDVAQQAGDSAQAFIDAPQAIADSCQTALTALVPGASAAAAAPALYEASARLDAALGGAAAVPGVSEIRSAFGNAAESLSAQPGDAGMESARLAVTAACAAFTVG